MCVYLCVSAGASISPAEPMMHFPLFQIPSISEKNANFPFPKIFLFYPPKFLMTFLFLVFDSKFRISPLFPKLFTHFHVYFYFGNDQFPLCFSFRYTSPFPILFHLFPSITSPIIQLLPIQLLSLQFFSSPQCTTTRPIFPFPPRFYLFNCPFLLLFLLFLPLLKSLCPLPSPPQCVTCPKKVGVKYVSTYIQELFIML